jgi:hypothetical protein
MRRAARALSGLPVRYIRAAPLMRALSAVALTLAAVAACTRFGPVYPPRPAPSDGSPIADPPPSRVVVHLTVAGPALRDALDASVPKSGDGAFPLFGGDRRYTWSRDPLDVGFAQGRIVLATKVHASVAVPLRSLDFPLDVRVEAEPVLSPEYAVRLQSVDVKVGSSDGRLALADRAAGVYEKVAAPIAERLRSFAYDLRPLLGEAQSRIAKPIPIPLGAEGEVNACAQLRVLGIEAGPTVLAGGLEKDVAIVVSPSITAPCEAPPNEPTPAALPPLANVASLAPGPFTVTVPIAARYEELTRAMSLAFTDGKLFFSTEYPELYLEKPELYESQGALVLKLHLAGPIHAPVNAALDGDLYLSGHPAVIDDELVIPDLEPTIETRNFLLSLKAMTDGDRIRDRARAALRLDLGARLAPVREKLSSELTFGDTGGAGSGCFHGDLDRLAVTGVFAHASYLRVYVELTARARASLPCAPGVY